MVLTELPSELIQNVFAWLTWKELLACQKVCKLFCTIVQSTTHLQYTIELAVSGYVHGAPDGHASAAELLANLRRHQDAWKDPAIDRAEIIEVEYDSGRPSSGPFTRYEIHDDVLVVLRRKGQLQHTHTFNSLDVMLLNCKNRSFPSWTLDFDREYTGLAFDPAQDLLILRDEGVEQQGSSNTHVVYTRFQPLSLKDGTPHPRVQVSDIRITQPVFLSMILLGDFIALPIIHDLRSIHSVILINWTTGESRLIRPASGLGRSVRTAHICFLSGRRLMTVDDRRPALDLYGCDNDTWDNVQHIAVLDLPHYRHYSISAAILTSSINSDTKCVYPSLRGFSPGFYPAPHRAALVALQLRFMPHAYNLDQDTKNYTIIICVPAMLDIIHQVRGETDVRIPTTIQWETWGASCTRWFGHLAPLHQLRMYGYRVVLPNRILDFNPLDIAIDLAIDEATWSAQSSAPGLGRGRPNSTRSGDASENIVTESSVIPQMNLFYQNISTRLLYRETVLERSLPFADLYPNHGIVGLETDRMRHINALHFLTV